MRNVHNIHHWTNYRDRQIDIFEIADRERDFREYVVVETDNSPGAHGRETRRERRQTSGYYDLALADSWARPLARSWQRERENEAAANRAYGARKNPVGKHHRRRVHRTDFWDTGAGTAVQIAAGLGVLAGVIYVARNWNQGTAAYALPVATTTLLASL